MKMFGLAATAVLLAHAVPALAQGNSRQLNLPAVITQPGAYELNRDAFVTGTMPAIRVMASGVTINLNGNQILGQGNNTGIGIEVVDVAGVTIRNGILANLGIAIRVAGSSGVTIEGMNIRGRNLAVSAPPPEVAIMIAQSTGVRVMNNNISNVGLGIFVRGGRSRGNYIANNNISGGTNGLFAICYNPTDTDPLSPRYDLIMNNQLMGFNVGIQFAATSGTNVTRGNAIFYRSAAIELNGTNSTDENNAKVQIP
ncbi:MAG: hypothetical protein OHK0021_13860 [Bryobacter sp.]